MPATRSQLDAHLLQLESAFGRQDAILELTARDEPSGLEGYVVVWNLPRNPEPPLGPCAKGGTRIRAELTLREIHDLARRMALKNAAAGLPLGGAKSGIRSDPADPRFEDRYRAFVRRARPFLHEFGGYFGGFGLDVGADPQAAHWVRDELGTVRSFTGKTVDLGGTDYDNEGIAGLGVAVAAEAALRELGLDPAGEPFAVQGLGAMGAAVTRYFAATGARLAAVSDPRIGGCYRILPEAADEIVAALSARRLDRVSALLETGGVFVDRDCSEVLYEEVAVLFPCALPNADTDLEPERIRATTVSEGANGAFSPEVRERLFATSGVTIIPDIIANPGGIIAAYTEMISHPTEADIRDRTIVERAKTMTRERIARNIREMMRLSREFGISGARAGTYIALRNLIEGTGSPD